MIARVLTLTLAASPVAAQEATPLVCLFRPVCAEAGCDTTSFSVEIAPIDHEPGLWFVAGSVQVPVRDVTPADARMQSFITDDPAMREIISVFRSGEAIYTRHFQRPGRGPDVTTAIGQCEVL